MADIACWDQVKPVLRRSFKRNGKHAFVSKQVNSILEFPRMKPAVLFLSLLYIPLPDTK